MIVLDSSAVIALLFDEPGADKVRDVLPSSILSAVNYAEVLSRYERDTRDSRPIAARLASEVHAIVPFDAALAYTAALLIGKTRPFGLSLGDRCCLSLAIDRKVSVLTADRVWLKLGLAIEIKTIR
jgi:PIN domain nuclease of toxin-antitoxin system